ncbi:MAG: FtsQ-type POTRA domain-containing protein [Anaerolineales bacterium]|nr:FtsQ-type POTRA domain-containing protein [Anaerolineales bacterium]
MSEKKAFSRSEVVRQRRLEQLRQQQQQEHRQQVSVQRQPRAPRPQKKQSRTKSGYRELPPIIARGVVNDFAVERRKKAGKRRFNAAISLPRPKLRSLSLPRMRIHIRWRLLSFFLVLLFGTGLYLFWSRPEFRVTTAQVIGNQRISADEINGVLDLNGYPVFMLVPDQIEMRVLRNYPELASVDVTISLPNVVTVNVAERQPVILWQQDDGYTWIDETGTAFRPRGEAPGLIVVQALSAPPALSTPVPASLDTDETEQAPVSVPDEDLLTPAPFISMETVKALIALAPHVPPGTPILYDPTTGLSWADGRGWQAVFGLSGEDTEIKVLVYRAMVDWLAQRGIRPILINVAYPSAPFYRVEQAEQVEQVEVETDLVEQ